MDLSGAPTEATARYRAVRNTADRTYRCILGTANGQLASLTGREVMDLGAEEELVLVRGKHARRVRRYDPATHPNHALATLAATASTR